MVAGACGDWSSGPARIGSPKTPSWLREDIDLATLYEFSARGIEGGERALRDFDGPVVPRRP